MDPLKVAMSKSSVIFLFLCANFAAGAEKATPFAISPQATELLKSYCFDCHDADSKKGDVQLDDLVGLSLKDRLELLNRAQEQLFTKRVP
jgi:cytochrome c553